MARVLQTSFEYYRRSQLQPLSLPARVRALARLLRDNLPMTMQGIGASLSPALGGFIAQYFGYRLAFLILGSFAIGSLLLWLAFASILKPACADETVPVPRAM